jgi:hypothetical protein
MATCLKEAAFDMMLHRYWNFCRPTWLGLQAGAYSRHDALAVLLQRMFEGRALPEIEKCGFGDSGISGFDLPLYGSSWNVSVQRRGAGRRNRRE